MEQKDTVEIITKNSKFFVLFLLILFFSLFSVSSFLLQSTSRRFLALITNPHFIIRIIVVLVGLCSYIFIPRVEFFKSNMFFLLLLGISYFSCFATLIFSRHSMPSFLGESIPIGFMVGISSVLVLTNCISENNLELQDIFMYSFIEATDIILLLLATDFTSAFVIFLTLTILSFHYGIAFALRVLLLNLLSVFMLIYFILLSSGTVSMYFDGLLTDEGFMNFYSNSSIYLASDRANATTIALTKGDIIFSFIKRFSVFGVVAFALVLTALIVMSLLASSALDRSGNTKESIRMYGLSVYMGFLVLFSMLSLATSLPVFRYDLPFISMSNIYVFLTIVVFAYIITPLLDIEHHDM